MLKRTIALLGIALLAAGCGTIMDTANIQCAAANNGPRVFGGVRTDVELMSKSKDGLGTTMLVLDVLPSLFYDAVLLPVSLPKQYAK